VKWQSFARLFAGFDGAYGTYKTTHPGSNGKVEMDGPATVREPVVDATWQAHLFGIRPIGIIPIDRKQQCRWGAIDVDVYPMDPLDVIRKVKSQALPLVVCRSKSGGAHAYLFLDKPHPAEAVRTTLKGFAARLGYGGAEVFPKQTKVEWDAGDLGNNLNLPYFNAEEPTRYAYNDDGQILDFDGFLDYATRHLTNLQTLRAEERARPRAAAENPEEDGPPCLQALYQGGFPPGARHNGLFAIGVWAKKAFPEDWERVLKEYHDRYFQPPKPKDLEDVKQSLTRKGYNFRCHEAPIAAYCNRVVCLQRRHGVSSLEGVPFSELTKIACDPPVYFLSVEDKRIQVTSRQLVDHKSIGLKTMEVLDRRAPFMNDTLWAAKLDSMFEALIVLPSLFPSDEELARQALLNYLRHGRRRAKGTEIDLAAAVHSPIIDGHEAYFNWSAFVTFYTKSVRPARGVLAALEKAIGMEATTHPLVQRIRLDEDIDT